MSENIPTTETAASGGIKRSPRTTARKPKQNQIPIGILLFVIMIGFGFYLLTKSSELSLYFAIGSCFGFILQKSRFCFTASFRDPFITGNTSVTKAVLFALFITTLMFTAIKYGFYANGLPIPGQSYIVPISFATIFGAIIFGIGMVIAGGCASGTLMRVGEGFQMQLLSITFFVIGSLWGAHDMGFWRINFISSAPKIFMPDVFGWAGAIFVQSAIIGCLYIAADLWEKKKMGSH